MTYTQPEITLLGDAARVIQGTKDASADAGSLDAELAPGGCEFDD
jgi:hypothetical protein